VAVAATTAVVLVAVGGGAAGGKALVRLTADPMAEGAPVYSPSGRFIAFVRESSTGSELWLMNADGAGERQLTQGARVSLYSLDLHKWSPDGKRIVYLDFGRGLFDVHVRTGVIRQLVSREMEPAEFAVSPDGKRIAFASDVDFEIYVADADGRNARSVTPQLPFSREPSWSPDGRTIAFTASFGPLQGGVFAVDADGSDLRNLTVERPDLHPRFPRWSPNGKKISFTAFTVTSDDLLEFDVYVMNADGTGVIDVSNLPGFAEDGRGWSADSRRIAFEATGGGLNVYVVDADGSDRTLVTEGHSAAWSPNGHWIALSGYQGGPSEDILAAGVKQRRTP
jgi:Tol biopolymer transport system component